MKQIQRMEKIISEKEILRIVNLVVDFENKMGKYMELRGTNKHFPSVNLKFTSKNIKTSFKNQKEIRDEQKKLKKQLQVFWSHILSVKQELSKLQQQLRSKYQQQKNIQTQINDQFEKKTNQLIRVKEIKTGLQSKFTCLSQQRQKVIVDIENFDNKTNKMKLQLMNLNVNLESKQKLITDGKYLRNSPQLQIKRISEELKQIKQEIDRSFTPSANIKQYFTNLVELEQQLIKIKQQNIETKDYDDFMQRINTQFQQSKSQTDTNQKNFNLPTIRIYLQKRLNLWKSKLEKKSKKQFEQKVNYYQKQLKELKKYEQVNEILVLRKKRQDQLFGNRSLVRRQLDEQFPQYTEILQIISKLKNISFKSTDSQELIKSFFIKYPNHAQKIQIIRKLKVSDKQIYVKRISQIKEQLQKVQLQWEANSDQEEEVILEDKRKKLEQNLESELIRIKFINFIENNQITVKTATKSPKSLMKQVYIAYEKSELPKALNYETIKLQSEDEFKNILSSTKSKLKELDQQYDVCTDDETLKSIENKQKQLTELTHKIKDQLLFIEFAKQKLFMLAQTRFNRFVLNIEDKKIYADLKLQINWPTQDVILTSPLIDSDALEKIQKEFEEFLDELSWGVEFEPLFRPMIKKHPLSREQIPTIEKLLKQLQNLKNPLNSFLLDKLYAMIKDGDIINIQNQFLTAILKDSEQHSLQKLQLLRKKFDQQQQNLHEAKEKLKEFNQITSEISKLKIEQNLKRGDIENANLNKSIAENRISELKQMIQAFQQQTKLLKIGSSILEKEKHEIQLQKDRIKNSLDTIRGNINFLQEMLKFFIIDIQKPEILISQFVEQQIKRLQITQKIVLEKKKSIDEELQKKKHIQEIESIKKKTNRSLEQINLEITKLNDQLKQITSVKAKQKEYYQLELKLQQINEKIEDLEKKAINLCSCLTNHQCQFECSGKCPDKTCSKEAGHPGSHLCSKQSHTCPQKCQIDHRCKRFCRQIFGHDQTLKHSCQNDHNCKEKCDYCDKKCTKSQFQEHKLHICDSNKKCVYKCIFCEKQCASKHHDHDTKAEVVSINQKDKLLLKRKLHLCENEHDCLHVCSQKGICRLSYKNTIRKWKRPDCQQQYTYIEQTGERDCCKIKIPAGQYKHKQPCSCLGQRHFCTTTCPDCKSICQRQMGHSGTHTAIHRNQQELIYVSETESSKIVVKDTTDNKEIQFIFNVGDYSEPTTCLQSCKRKGRAHYHLMECKGGLLCGQIKYKEQHSVKHSPKVYYPYFKKSYDLFLCSEYWNTWNFEMPCPGLREEFSQCNFACLNMHDGDPKKKQFCNGTAWHSFSPKRADHQFRCDDIHKTLAYHRLQVCFLIDRTESMRSFIIQARKTIAKIIQSTKEKHSQIYSQFSVVGYSDHPIKFSDLFKKQKKATSQKLEKLLDLKQVPLHAEKKMTQKEYIDTLISIDKKIRVKQSKKEEMKGGWSEEQKFILDNHFPYFRDIDTHRGDYKLATQAHKKIAARPQKEIQQSEPLIKYLITELKKVQQAFVSQQKEEDNVISKLGFTTAESAMKFLQELKAEGGDDFPEAVLDGMNEVTSLNWSKDISTLKYVFHIFDAPPHGKIYDTDNGDRYPEGCPCGLRHEKIIPNFIALDLNYVAYPLTSRVNSTINLFEKSGLKVKRKNINKDEPEEMTKETVEIICAQLEQTDIMAKAK